MAKYTVDELALLSEKSEAERQVVATVEWHDKHCFFLLLEMVRGKAQRIGYTGFPEVLGHAEQCALKSVACAWNLTWGVYFGTQPQ